MDSRIDDETNSNSGAFADLAAEALASGLAGFEQKYSCPTESLGADALSVALSSGISGQGQSTLAPGSEEGLSNGRVEGLTAGRELAHHLNSSLPAKTFTDQSGVEIKVSSDGSTTKKYPSFDASRLPSLYLKNESAIDSNRDGYLDRSEIAKSILSQDFKGEDAQFLAALQIDFEHIRGQKTAIFGFDRAGVGFDDIEELASKAEKQSAMSSRILGYEAVVREKFNLEKGEITSVDVKRVLADSKLDRQSRERLTQFFEDFDKYKKFDLNPFGTPAISLDSFNQGVKEQTTGSDFAVVSAMEGFVDSGTKAVEAFPDKLWKDESNPLTSITPEAVLQGSIGTCAFLAALASLAAVAPDKVKDMIEDNRDGSYTVTFPGAPNEPIKVTKPTESEAMLYAQRSSSGYWVQVAEKAYGQYRVAHNTVNPRARDIGSAIPSEGGDGGAPLDEALKLLSERPIKMVGFKGASDDLFRMSIERSLKTGSPVTLSVIKSADEFKQQQGKLGGLSNEHAYSVIGYDAKNQLVKIRNPQGSGELRRELLSKDCKDDGVFELPVSKLREYFYEMAFSVDK